MPFHRLACLILTLSLFALPFVALAQEEAPAATVDTLAASPAPPPVEMPPGVPSLDDNALAFAGVLVQLAQAGQWGAFAALAVFALVWALRRFAVKLPAGSVRDFLTGTWGGWLLNFVTAIAAGFAGVAFVGAPLGLLTVLGIIGGGVTYALGAAGLLELGKDFAHRKELAANAGKEAAAGVMTKSQALQVFDRRGPQP